MCHELKQQGKNVDQAGSASVHTTVTQLAQTSGGGSGNSGGSRGKGTPLYYICDIPDYGYCQCPLFGRN